MNRLLASWEGVTGLLAVALAVLVGVGLPIVAPGTEMIAIGLAAAIIVVWVALFIVRRSKARAASDAIAGQLAGAGAEEDAIVAQRMREALGQFKSASGGSRDYLYSRPWYVIIGPPGAGKTTALLNSGLRFPFADQSLKGIGGTRNLDFWFADEAAIVDTAGRYTSQDSDASADSAGWRSLLQQLRTSRPKQPINGVIVALGVDELLRADLNGIDGHAAKVRARLTELNRALGTTAPVYLLLTKADLLAGFVEFYDDLDVEGRRAVLGVTLPDPDSIPAHNEMIGAFDRFIAAQGARQAKRLKEERDPTRRSLILGFPTQLGSLRTRLSRFIGEAFRQGDSSGTLRGFYFTSGVQEGAPLDRLLAGVADVYQSTATPQQQGQSGRTYFLNRLLRQVVFREAGLVQTGKAARERQRKQLIGALAAVGIATLLIIGLLAFTMLKGNRGQGAQVAMVTSAAPPAVAER
ncbi:MAG: type VI secretion system membrane subunit TssM [Novosphingobium sp.]